MICLKCKNVLDPDPVVLEESRGSMEEYYCAECKIWIDENGEVKKLSAKTWKNSRRRKSIIEER